MPQTSRIIPLLIAVAGAGCVRSSAPVGTDALAGRVTAYAPVPADPPASPGPPKPPEQSGPPAPTLPGPEPITLAEARALAERVNPQLNRVRETVNRAAAEERIVFADFLPSLGFSQEFHGVTSRVGTTMKPGRRFAQLPVRGFGPGAQDFQVLDLELRYTVFQFGKRLARHDQAVLRWDIARLQTERARQSIVFEVSVQYAELLESFAVREIAERTVGRAEAVLKDAVNLEKQGVLTREDVLRAEVQVADARQALTSARSAVSVAHAALNRSIGITVGYPTRVTEDALPIEHPTAGARQAPPPEFDLELVQCLDLAVRNRPEFVVVQKAIQEAVRGADATRADYLPTFGTQATGSLVDGVAVQNATVLDASIFLKWDFFAGGRRVGAVLAAESDVRAAAAEAQEVCDTIAFEVHVAFANIEDARERIKQTRKAVEQARETLRLVQARYARGDAKPTDVVDAQTALTRAEQNANDARYGYLIALARMEFATGVPLAALLRPADPDALPPPRPVLPPKGAGGVGGKGP